MVLATGSAGFGSLPLDCWSTGGPGGKPLGGRFSICINSYLSSI